MTSERNLFQTGDTGSSGSVKQPLADRMRPESLQEVVGQDHLLSAGKFLHEVIQSGEIPSMILWGPPGTGKTTLAQIIARSAGCHFVSLSAVLAGVKDVKKVVDEARYQLKGFSRRTILFVDEIHRFNKAQQDAFLPHVEDGTVVLIGATTENPSFEVISPLLSRLRVLVLNALKEADIERLLRRALEDPQRGLAGYGLSTSDDALSQIALFANGDARIALNSLEVSAQLARQENNLKPVISLPIVEEALQHRTILYDKGGEEHYNLISALHKSMRNSDVDASLYWLGRMLEAGEDPLYIARRLVRFASEDVGMADPRALGMALDSMQAYHFIGLPEGKLALAQAVVYLAQAPKSNALYVAYKSIQKEVEMNRNEPVPLAIRNAPTSLMKDLGYGEGYRYAHDEAEKVSDMQCLPDRLANRKYFIPTDEGYEKLLAQRLEEIKRRRSANRKKS